MNKQAKLFQDQDVANDDLSLTPVIKKKGRTKLTAAQSEFNRLNRKINELKAEITLFLRRNEKSELSIRSMLNLYLRKRLQ